MSLTKGELMNLIELKNINLTYNDVQIFKDFNFTVRENEKVLIIGKSGCGKSSILKLLLGFTEMQDGKYLYKGEEVTNYQDIRKNYSFVNQDVTLRNGKVKKILMEISEFSNNNFDGTIDKKLAEYFEFNMNLLKKNINELSGGERQRLGLLIAIQLDRPVFLFDEITSALDSELKNKTVEYFKNIDKTVIVVSHDLQWLDSGFRKVDINGNN
jgi:putative ABC transport system ATP-binding protein